MKSFRIALVALLLAVVGCSTFEPCAPSVGTDLGGWMVDEASTLAVHRYCVAGEHRFVLQALAERDAEGRVTRWTDLADLLVRVRTGERLMFGFECGSDDVRRGNVIAVVSDRTDTPLRAWRVDTSARQFVAVSPQTVRYESIE